MNLEDSAHLYQRKGMASFIRYYFKKNMYWCLYYLWYWISNVHVKTMSGWSLIKLHVFVITFSEWVSSFVQELLHGTGTSDYWSYYYTWIFIFRLAEIILWFYMWNYSRNSLKFCFRLGLITILRNIFSLISIAGCPEAAIKNIYNAVKCGVTHGCTGIVACDWSGKAHLNSHVFSWPAYMLNLGLSWNSNCHQVWQTYQQIISVNNEWILCSNTAYPRGADL